MNEKTFAPKAQHSGEALDSVVRIGEVTFAKVDDTELLTIVEGAVAAKRPLSIVHPNVHHLDICRSEPALVTALSGFDYIVPDGVGVYLAARFLHGRAGGFRRRQTGTDFYFSLLKLASNLRWRIFFLGDTPEVLDALVARLKRDYEGVIVAGVHDGFFDPEERSVVEMARASKADLLMIGMGAPRQELWLQNNKEMLDIPVSIVVGAGISFMSGVKKRAPMWVRAVGLEWLYRTTQEPRRLWRRYIVGIPAFFFYLLRLKLRTK